VPLDEQRQVRGGTLQSRKRLEIQHPKQTIPVDVQDSHS